MLRFQGARERSGWPTQASARRVALAGAGAMLAISMLRSRLLPPKHHRADKISPP